MDAKFNGDSWSLALDQHNRPVWHNGKDKATYEAPSQSAMFQPWGPGHVPQPATGTVVFVGDKCKEDKWTEYKDKNGKAYYHNPTKGPSTWDKPKDFDKKKNAGKPAPPTKPKAKQPKYKSNSKVWWI